MMFSKTTGSKLKKIRFSYLVRSSRLPLVDTFTNVSVESAGEHEVTPGAGPNIPRAFITVVLPVSQAPTISVRCLLNTKSYDP